MWPAARMSSHVAMGDASRRGGCAIGTMTVATMLMREIVPMWRAILTKSLPVPTISASRPSGGVMGRVTVPMDLMRGWVSTWSIQFRLMIKGGWRKWFYQSPSCERIFFIRISKKCFNLLTIFILPSIQEIPPGIDVNWTRRSGWWGVWNEGFLCMGIRWKINVSTEISTEMGLIQNWRKLRENLLSSAINFSIKIYINTSWGIPGKSLYRMWEDQKKMTYFWDSKTTTIC